MTTSHKSAGGGTSSGNGVQTGNVTSLTSPVSGLNCYESDMAALCEEIAGSALELRSVLYHALVSEDAQFSADFIVTARHLAGRIGRMADLGSQALGKTGHHPTADEWMLPDTLNGLLSSAQAGIADAALRRSAK